MFTLQGRREFVPQKACYLPDSLVAGLHPSAGCPMHADGEAFRRFVKTFGLNATDEANEIAALTESVPEDCRIPDSWRRYPSTGPDSAACMNAAGLPEKE